MFGSAASKVSSSLPVPAATAEQAGKAAAGFSEAEALKHVKALAEFASHPAAASGRDLDSALQYVLKQGQAIKEAAPEDVDVEVDLFPAESGDSDPKHVVIRILPKNASEAYENAVLVSAHIDTVFSAEGAGDDTSNVGVMLELARGISQSAHGFKNSVIFFLNTSEEEGLNGSHSFINQQPWSDTVRVAINLDGIPTARESRTPQVQDLFSSGIKNSEADARIYKEIAGLSGLDFEYSEETHAYHIKNDKLELLKPGSLQHLGENMLPFLLQVASSPILS